MSRKKSQDYEFELRLKGHIFTTSYKKADEILKQYADNLKANYPENYNDNMRGIGDFFEGGWVFVIIESVGRKS